MTKLAPGWTVETSEFLKSPEGRRVHYMVYRVKTGLCETCGESMKSHPKCDACGALSGSGHLISCSRYRGHARCGDCQRAWERLDRIIGRKTTWEEFLRPEGLFSFPKGGAGFTVKETTSKEV